MFIFKYYGFDWCLAMLYIRERVVDFREDSIKYPREEEKPQERPAPATTRSVYSQNSSKSQEGGS